MMTIKPIDDKEGLATETGEVPPTKRKKLVLIDGHAMMHRAFHAVPEQLTTRSGEAVNATFGFTSMLLKALTEEKPDYIAMTFDRPAPTFRHLHYSRSIKPSDPLSLISCGHSLGASAKSCEPLASPSMKKMASRPMTCSARSPCRRTSRAWTPSSTPANGYLATRQ